MQEYYLKPWEILELTMTEIAVFILAARRSQEEMTIDQHAGPMSKQSFINKFETMVARGQERHQAWLAVPLEERLGKLHRKYGLR